MRSMAIVCCTIVWDLTLPTKFLDGKKFRWHSRVNWTVTKNLDEKFRATNKHSTDTMEAFDRMHIEINDPVKCSKCPMNNPLVLWCCPYCDGKPWCIYHGHIMDDELHDCLRREPQIDRTKWKFTNRATLPRRSASPTWRCCVMTLQIPSRSPFKNRRNTSTCAREEDACLQRNLNYPWSVHTCCGSDKAEVYWGDSKFDRVFTEKWVVNV